MTNKFLTIYIRTLTTLLRLVYGRNSTAFESKGGGLLGLDRRVDVFGSGSVVAGLGRLSDGGVDDGVGLGEFRPYPPLPRSPGIWSLPPLSWVWGWVLTQYQ